MVDLVKEFWCVFREDGVPIPIKGYEMVIDTGRHPPCKCRNSNYGPHETDIINKQLQSLEANGFIEPDTDSPFMSRIVLAPKPHQHSVSDIDEFVWRLCISYVALNKITRVIAYPIPRCDRATMDGIGKAVCFVLLDAFSGYHQVLLSLASRAKTAFAAPLGRKYHWLVMPFGLVNGPAVFTIIMNDLREVWMALYSSDTE